MSLGDALKIGSAGLRTQRARMEAVASNLANVETTRTPEGGPYRRRMVVVSAERMEPSFQTRLDRSLRTVKVDRVVTDPRPPALRYQPSHPDANAEGYVAYPNVDPAEEMVDMVSATRSYEANVAVIRSVRSMLKAALRILR